MKCNPVARTPLIALSRVNAGQIGAVVAVKVRDGEVAAGLTREGARTSASSGNRRETAKDGQRYPDGPSNQQLVETRSHGLQIRSPAKINARCLTYALDLLKRSL